jgi:hypothetical protein
MILNGAFNTITKQFLGNDPENYLIRDDERSVIVWGQLDATTGRFTATRNPIRYVNGGMTVDFDVATGKQTMSGVEIDNRVDYRGSHFYDEAFMQRGTDGKLQVTDAMAYAAHLSSEAKEGKLAAGDIADLPKTRFFTMDAKKE